jgi:hypothetical protein
VKDNKPAKTAHLPGSQAVTWMGRQPGVINLFDRRVVGQEFCDLLGGLVLLFHAQGQRFHPAQQQVGRVGVRDPAQDANRVAQRLDELSPAGDKPGQQVVMPAQVLGGRVHHQVDAPLQRAGVDRGCQGRVDHGDCPVLFADFRKPFQVQDAQVGVGWRFGKEHPGFRANGGPRASSSPKGTTVQSTLKRFR